MPSKESALRATATAKMDGPQEPARAAGADGDLAAAECRAAAAECRAAATVWDRRLASYLPITWETAAWLALMVLAAVARFYALGARAMSHDESLHALYSYYLYDAGNYEHNPMMHGPFLFHANALVYFLFGDNDASARLVPALSGLGVLGMIYLLRVYIGRTGALMAGILAALSPSLLFHSRYIRNDIYIALFTLIWIYGAFRSLDAAPGRQRRWLVAMVLGMAMGFITKEVHFMVGAILGVFFVGLALWQAIGRRVFAVAAPPLLAAFVAWIFHELDNDTISLIALAVGAAAALAVLALFIRRPQWQILRASRAADLAVVMLTLALPFTAPFGHVALGWDAMAYATTQDLLRSASLVLLVTGLSCGIAYFWFGMRRPAESDAEDAGVAAEAPLVTFKAWGSLMGLFWLIQVLFFTTFMTNTRNGLATGIVGSLGYWLKQQEVARGGQPWYYYYMLTGLYEFLPLILAAVGVAVAIYWSLRQPNWDPVPAQDLPPARQPSAEAHAAGELLPADALRENRFYFAWLGIWWTLASLFAYTVAGEKMPWLLVHIALPMCVFGGWYLGWLITRVDWPQAWRTRAVWLIGVTPALLFVLATLLGALTGLGRTADMLASAMQWLLALLIAAGLLYLTVKWARAVGWLAGARLLALGLVALLFLLTVRFTFMLNYINYDLVTEYLVYAHGGPGVKLALQEIDELSERTAGGRDIVVAYDNDSSWPMSWYMRQYPNAKYYGDAPSADSMAAPVIIVGPQNYDKVHPYVERDYIKRVYQLVWWPDQGYFDLTVPRLLETLRSPEKLRRIADIVFYRRHEDPANPGRLRPLSQWPNRHDFELWVRRDMAAQIWDLGAAPAAGAAVGGGATLAPPVAAQQRLDLVAKAELRGPYAGLPLYTPRALAVASDGRRVIADTGNHRIVVLSAAGELLLAYGSHCRLGEGEGGGCVDPDGDGPLTLGDGQFFEPWGVAVDEAGNIYVADTWNGRIQVFDPEGNLLRKWGAFNSTNGQLGDPYMLFGPRGLAVDGGGNLLVADTGNKRILRFTPAGELLQQVGGGGNGPGRFEEPVDVAVSPDTGYVYVTDAWNRRIQILDQGLAYLAEWPVPGWHSQDVQHKPYLAVIAGGEVYASDPESYRILVYNPVGGLKAEFGSFGAGLNQFGLPNGVAADPRSGEILVADAGNGRVLAFDPVP